MSSFASLFKKMYYQNEKNNDEITNKSIHSKLIILLENNKNDKIDENDLLNQGLLENDINLIANGLMSQSEDVEEEKSKQILLKSLMDGKGINIKRLANKYKESLNKEIYYLRKKIISLIKSKPNINSINNGEDLIFDENSFYSYLSQGKELIANFLSKYRITKRFILNSKLFDDILENYQSFNLKCLSDLMNYLEDFDNFYKIYMNFATIIKSINKINNIIKMKNGEIDSKYVDNIYQGLEEGSFNISSLFNKLNKKLEKIEEQVKENFNEIKKLKIDNEKLKIDNEKLKSELLKANKIISNIQNIQIDNNEIKKLKDENEKLKIDNKKLKIDNDKLNNRVEALENSLKNIKSELKCPITNEIMKSPVITPYGFTYEEKEIKNWINKTGTEPMNRQPLAEDQLIKNYGLKNVITKYNDIMGKK